MFIPRPLVGLVAVAVAASPPLVRLAAALAVQLTRRAARESIYKQLVTTLQRPLGKSPLPVARAPPSMSGFTRKKFAGSPAAIEFACRVGSPARPVVELVPAGVNGFELYRPSAFTKFELVQLALL